MSELETLKLTIIELEKRNAELESSVSVSSSKYVIESEEQEKKYEQDILAFKNKTDNIL